MGAVTWPVGAMRAWTIGEEINFKGELQSHFNFTQEDSHKFFNDHFEALYLTYES